MSDENRAELNVSAENGALLVKGDVITEAGDAKWVARTLDDKRLLLTTEEGRLLQSPASGLIACPVDVLKEFILSLHHAGWSGVVSVDTGYGAKRLFISRGQLVFAASSIIDDRLGEVIYREARITLDELTNSAAQVTKARKFGQVLIASNIFTNVQLWQALKLQVKQILRSIFMVDKVFVEMQAGHGLAPTEVVFPETFPELVNEGFSFGNAYRDFLAKLRQDSRVQLLIDKGRIPVEHQPGTFVGDLLQLIEAQGLVQELLDSSKLIDVYTIAALFHLVNLGLCKVTPDVDEVRKAAPELATLRAKLDAYAYIFEKVRKSFADGGKTFPLTDVHAFAASLNPEGFPSLFLDGNAQLSRDSVSGMFSQCAGNVGRVAYFNVRIESLIQFLLQVAGDNLDFKTASRIRQDYRSVSA